MRLSNSLLVLGALCQAVLGKPVRSSVLDSAAVWDGPLEGRMHVSKRDLAQIARRAALVNAASCPPTTAPVPLVSRGLPHDSVIIASSDDPEREDLRDEIDLGWYIAHTPSTQTLTLAISSLPTVDELLEVLASDPEDGEELVSLPSDLFDAPPTAQIHHSFLPSFQTHGLFALDVLLNVIENPPALPPSMIPEWAWKLIGRSAPSPSIKRVEIMGHGLGSALGLLVSLSLQSVPAAQDLIISSTLFSLPRVGDEMFAHWIDELQSPNWQLRRITSYADTIPHLPAAHNGYAQPQKGEIWVGADPRTAYACLGEEGHEMCSESIPLQKTKLEDHDGPFGGVWIKGVESCRARFNLAAL